MSAWFGYGQFGLKCGCTGGPSPPPARASPPPPLRSPPPSPPPPPPPPSLVRVGCELYDSGGGRVDQITGPISGSNSTVYGTATLTVDNPPGYLSLVLSLNAGVGFVRRDTIHYQFYTSEGAFATSISSPGTCTRYPPSRLTGEFGCGYTPSSTNTISVPLKSLVSNTCSSVTTIYVVVYLPLVGRGQGEGRLPA